MYKKDNPEEAANIYRRLAAGHMAKNNFSTAARMYKTVAEIFEEDKDYNEALDAYQQAADCFIADDQQANAQAAQLKVAHYAAKLGDHQRAIDIFEEVAESSLHNDLRKWSCKQYYFDACLCLMALHVPQGHVEIVEEKFGDYVSKYPALEGTREQKFVNAVIDCINSLNYEKFKDSIYDYDQISRFDEWQSQMIIPIKQYVRDPNGNGVVDPINDDVFMDGRTNNTGTEDDPDRDLE